MKVFLENNNLYAAVVCYMALKGFDIDEHYEIEANTQGKLKGFHIKIEKSSNHKLEDIKRYAEKY